MGMRGRITAKGLATFTPEDGKWSEGSGFYVECLGKGRKAFRLQKRIRGAGTSSKSFQLGYWPDMTIQEAREKASDYRKECDAGNDPRKTIEQRRKAQRADGALDLITVEDIFNWWYVERNSTKQKPTKQSTVQNYRYVINGVSKSWWHKPVRSIDEGLVEKHHTQYLKDTGHTEQARLWVNIMRSLFKEVVFAFRKDGQKLIEVNPFLIIRGSTQSKKREGHLRDTEINHIFEQYFKESAYLKQGRNEPFAFPLELEAQHNALTLCAFTGLRVSEVLAIKQKDWIKKGDTVRGERVDRPLLRVFIKKSNVAELVLKYFPVTPLIEKVLEQQALVRERFLDRQGEEVKRGGVIRNYKKEWESDYIFFSHHKKGVRLNRKLEKGVGLWRGWIGEPLVWQWAKEEAKPIDKNKDFSPHWLRHSFTTIAEGLGYDADVDVANLLGKTVKGKTSQSGYSHDDTVEDAEDSRVMLERIQSYMVTEAFQSRESRKAFKQNRAEDIDLTDPEKLADPSDHGNEDSLEEVSVVPGGHDSTKENLV